MEALATYLIKSSVWLTGFALVYALFLRNERFFVLNRIYLVSGILVSIIFPLFTWHYTVVLPVVPTSEVFEPQIQGITEVNEPFLTQNMLLLFMYISGITYLIFRILWQTLPVFHIIRKSEVHQHSSAKLIRTAEYPASFSFFSFVFVNPSIDEIETREIVNHELEHIRQQHWIDLLLFEILRTIQWFNPAIWLYGHLIRQNHEYLADERALQRSSNPAIYRAALLNQMFGGPVISLANSFNYSLNKKRFTMMKQTISSPIRKLKLLLVLPLIAGVFYAFAAPEYKFILPDNNAKDEKGRHYTLTINGKEYKTCDTEDIKVVQDEKTVTGRVISEEGKPLKSASVIISGKTIGTITDDNGNFVLKVTDDSPIVISYVGYKTETIPAPKPDFTYSITMKTATFAIDLIDKTSTAAKNEQVNLNNTNPLVIVDGKEIYKAEMAKIDPERIEKIEVIKDKTSVEKYGEKGKDGVILITLKKGESIDGKSNITNMTGNFALNSIRETTPKSSGILFSAKEIRGENKDGITILKADTFKLDFAKTNSLILIDGKKSTKDEVNQLNPAMIESISVLKDESATTLYGDKGKNGVVLIVTKKDKAGVAFKTDELVVTGYGSNQKVNPSNQSNTGIQIRSTGTTETSAKKANDVFFIVEEMPEFPGGQVALRALLASSLEYPLLAKEKGIEGKVFVNFVIAKDGSVTDTKIARSVDPLLDKEALRVVNNQPTWKPGKQGGEAVRVSYTVPVNFQLTEGNANNSNPLIVKDGVVSPNTKMDDINPNEIESVNVLKGELATAKYGDKGKNGVLEITTKKTGDVFTIVEEMPQFPGGTEALKTFVYSTLKYPTIALENGIQGQVFVKFVVSKTGKPINAKVSRGVDPSLDKEAVRIVESMPKWSPGKQQGENVDVTYEMPINFVLPGDYHMKSNEKLRATANSYTKNNKTLKLSIVPNPTSDNARITLVGSESTNKLEISIYDSTGKLIRKESKNGSTFSLSINKLPPGTYLVVGLESENQNKVSSQLVVNQ